MDTIETIKEEEFLVEGYMTLGACVENYIQKVQTYLRQIPQASQPSHVVHTIAG